MRELIPWTDPNEIKLNKSLFFLAVVIGQNEDKQPVKAEIRLKFTIITLIDNYAPHGESDHRNPG